MRKKIYTFLGALCMCLFCFIAKPDCVRANTASFTGYLTSLNWAGGGYVEINTGEPYGQPYHHYHFISGTDRADFITATGTSSFGNFGYPSYSDQYFPVWHLGFACAITAADYIGEPVSVSLTYTSMDLCSFGSGYTLQLPTCTVPGYYVYTCSVCGGQKHVQYAEALGHNWVWAIDSYATCTKNGYKHQYCTRCGATQNNNTLWQTAVGHNWQWVVDSELSCTTDYTGHKTCIQSVHDTTKDGPVNLSTVTFMTKPGHHYEELINDVEATCTTDGKSHYQCTNIINGVRCTDCEEPFTVPATGHFITSDSVTTKPSVYNNGERTYYCEYCGEAVTTRSVLQRLFNAYVGDKKVSAIYIGDTLIWNGSLGEVGSDGGKTTTDDAFSLIENNWYYKNNHYVNPQNVETNPETE